MQLVNATRDRVVAEHVEIAETVWARMRGLLGRADFPKGHALIINPCGSVHTCFMKFAIDVVFVDTVLTVARIVPDLRPWRFAGSYGAVAVIELPAGTLERTVVCQGDRLELTK